ncbi:hypothetical protein [Marinilabilia salmonicolor]|jgi:hypothetical protein|uniref:Uncharacterized protein n=1 Tax=Marinilabilia salmonicolor TaxID=989 RepID=A0A2T0XS93_9BACT|nr:hypothetical protein [Marinilabilia salmonicolor]PRZ01824.1 hypothetical protein BY457_102232 [Marinilabilia salmonicolor]RCW29844.1 hypothetical protein DFO77_12537 [Marinilabilia salmonicolor]
MKKQEKKSGKSVDNPAKAPKETKRTTIPGLKARKITFKRPDLIDAVGFEKFSPGIQEQLNELMEHEKIITAKLRNPKEKELFVQDPGAFLEKHKIKVSPFLERKMKGFRLQEILPVEDFMMPNGQRLVPKIRINIK